jgi:hypothetical protein
MACAYATAVGRYPNETQVVIDGLHAAQLGRARCSLRRTLVPGRCYQFHQFECAVGRELGIGESVDRCSDNNPNGCQTASEALSIKLKQPCENEAVPPMLI